MVEFFCLLEFPDDVERDVDSVAAELEDGGDVGLEGVAYGHELAGGDAKFIDEMGIFLLCLVGDDFDAVEVLEEAGALGFAGLVEEVAFGEADEGVAAAVVEGLEGLFDAFERGCGVVQELAAYFNYAADLVACDLAVGDLGGGFEHGEGEIGRAHV